MKLILRSDVQNVGRAGDVKEVAAGFGRNFLIPRKLAVPATPAALRWWEKGQARRAKLTEARLREAKELAGKLSGVNLSFARPAGPEGRIFGSVGKTDILKSLKTCGFTVEKQAVVLESAIKQTGDHEVELRLHPEASARIKVTVVPRS